MYDRRRDYRTADDCCCPLWLGVAGLLVAGAGLLLTLGFQEVAPLETRLSHAYCVTPMPLDACGGPRDSVDTNDWRIVYDGVNMTMCSCGNALVETAASECASGYAMWFMPAAVGPGDCQNAYPPAHLQHAGWALTALGGLAVIPLAHWVLSAACTGVPVVPN